MGENPVSAKFLFCMVAEFISNEQLVMSNNK